MIKFVENRFQVCNSCLSTKEDIKTLRVSPDNGVGGMAIMLCANCRKKINEFII